MRCEGSGSHKLSETMFWCALSKGITAFLAEQTIFLLEKPALYADLSSWKRGRVYDRGYKEGSGALGARRRG